MYSSGADVMILFWIIVLILVVVANFSAIGMLVDIANKKGVTDKNGKLWLIGLFATSITLGLIVCALPSGNVAEPAPGDTPQAPTNQLPEV